MRLAVFEGYNGIVDDLLSSQVQSITVKTQYGPDLVLDHPFEPGPPSPLLSAMKPQIEIQLQGSNPIKIAPYGAPAPTAWPVIKWTAIALAALGIIHVVRGRLR